MTSPSRGKAGTIVAPPTRIGPPRGRIREIARAIAASLPQGRTLPDEVWARRHRGLLVFLWLQVLLLPIYGIERGYGAAHSVVEGGVLLAALATFGTVGTTRRMRAVAVSLGLLTTSALGVHFSDGQIEAHFYFFVMVVLLTLYEDWVPFAVAVGYVVLHHGVFGALDAASVYNHADAQAYPWKWAGIHGAFVLMTGAAGVISWRLNEDTRTETVAALERARESEKLFKQGFDGAPIGMALTDSRGRYLRVNRALCEMTGYTESELLARDFQSVTHPEDLRSDLGALEQMLSGTVDSHKTEKRYVCADGETISALLNVSVVRGPDGGVDHLFSQVQDITERKRAEQDLQGSLSMLRATLESTADGILVVDTEGRIVNSNSEFMRMWGIPESVASSGDDGQALDFVMEQLKDPDAFVGKVRELYSTPEAESYDVLEFKDGRVFERYSQPQLLNAECVGRVWSFRDITDRKIFELELQHLADHDALTGLFNRRRFDEELEREVARSARYGEPGALLVLDLDNFKFVNDTLGHPAGDQVVMGIAALLRKRLRETDVIARLGGDEFAVLLSHTAPAEATQVAESLQRTIREKGASAGGKPVRVTTSLGVALFKEGPTTAQELLAAADLALYEAKDDGRDRIVVYTPHSGGQARQRARASWVDRIRRALEEDRFLLYAQPILNLETEEISQYELLLRMLDDGGEIIPPAAFLDTAERFGLIQSIDRWVVTEAIRLMDRRLQAGENLRLEVNVSGKSVDDPELPALIQRELAATNLNPDHLILEITETALISNMDEARKFAETLTRVGCRFALDDFGAGFGSYFYLKHLPVNYIKIDGDFIRLLPSSPTDQLMVKAMVQVAEGLGVQTIAEFVESEAIMDFLREYGVDYAQGYHVGRPQPVTEIWPDEAD